MKVIARIHTDFKEKFGIPRQSGLVEALEAKIVFEPEYRNPHALKGLEDFTHLWLIWEFSKAKRETWSPTVRPPRLGGNERLGVFATRSPFRPNSIGLSCVKIKRIQLESPQGPVIYVSGADILDGTPIYDLKPYIPYVDCHPEASGGFSEKNTEYQLEVRISETQLQKIPEPKREALVGILQQDPRPAYQKNADREYGLEFAGYNIRFHVEEKQLIVTDICKS